MEPYVEKPYTNRQQQLLAITSFCLIISTIAVGFRLVARHQFGVKLWWDDYMCIVALVNTNRSDDGIEAHIDAGGLI